VLRVENQNLGRQQDQIRAAVRQLARRLAAGASLLAPEEMVLLPAGDFAMGSATGLGDERPVHRVSVSAFYLDRYEVRRIAFQEFLVSQGQQAQADPRDPDLPATMVNWSDAAAYCQARGKRLPTESEWEYAARGTAGRTFPWGEARPTVSLARFAADTPLPVDTLPAGATPEGIHHLAGNVAEWVQDWWDPGYYAVSPPADPPGPPAGDYRVARGGAWDGTADELRAAGRAYHAPERGAAHLGFRCARDAAGSP
jgi:formylglycine-generating enzyme required for sulfatase activity